MEFFTLYKNLCLIVTTKFKSFNYARTKCHTSILNYRMLNFFLTIFIDANNGYRIHDFGFIIDIDGICVILLNKIAQFNYLMKGKNR